MATSRIRDRATSTTLLCMSCTFGLLLTPFALVSMNYLKHLKNGKANEIPITGVAAVMCSYNRYEMTI